MQSSSKKKSLLLSYLLSMFLGAFGIHLFYLGKKKRGIIYLLFSWTGITVFLGFYDLLFIHKWFKEYNGFNPVIKKTQAGYERHINSSKSKIEKIEEVVISEHKFYDVNEHIRPEYAHLKTPKYILDDIKNHCSLNKNKIQTDYGTFSISYSNRFDSFIRDSIRYATVTGSNCNHVPLSKYYTQFDNLNEAQLRWYFYWRNQVLNKNYLEADLSYIYLFLYELINFSFNQDAAFNASMIATIGEVYNGVRQYSELWLNDLLIELNASELKSCNKEENNRLYNIMEKHDHVYDKISIGSWKPYISVSRETVFFANYKNTIYKIFKMGVVLLNDYSCKHGSSVVDRWFKDTVEKRRLYLYNGAVFDRDIERESSYSVIVKTHTDCLSHEITALFRLSENITRELFNEKRKIKVDIDHLPEGFENAFKNYVTINYSVNDKGERFKLVKTKEKVSSKHKIPSPPKNIVNETTEPELVFDMERISSLSDESDHLIKAFKERGLDETDEIEKIDRVVESSKITFEDIFFDDIDEDEQSFVSSLNDLEKEYITNFVEMKYAANDSNTFFQQSGVMAGAFISDLNEKAFNCLDDNFIHLEQGSYVIFEDYEDIVKKIQREQRNEN